MVPDRRQIWPPSLMTLFVAFSSDLPELYCQKFDKTILLMKKNYSNHMTKMAVQGS